MSEPLVLYFQVTLGPAHRARIRALDALPGVACIGVQLASGERTRDYTVDADPDGVTLVPGVYEELPAGRIVAAATRLVEERRPHAVILEAVSDRAQRRIARRAQRLGARAFLRFASTWDDYPRQAWKQWLKRPLYRGWDGFLATGEAASDYLETFGVPASDIHVCGNPVDVRPIAQALEAAGGIASGADREGWLLYVGRFIWHKNLPRFLRAYRAYREAGGRLGLRIAGGFGDDDALVRAEARQLEGVELLGHLAQADLVPLYLRCAALVLPSISENWGLVVNEAMHAGAPVLVSSRCGCIPELVEDGGNGLLMDPEDEDDMAAALRRFESLPRERRVSMGRRSLELVATQTPERWARAVRDAVLPAEAGVARGR